MREKVIVITGGASGIGLSIVRALHKDNRVISLDRNGKKIDFMKREFPDVVSIKTDLLNNTEVDYAIKQISEKYSKVDLLINNAGVGRQFNFLAMEADSLKTLLLNEGLTNYIMPIVVTKKFIPLLENSSQPVVVFTTSGLAYTPIASFAGYCASKAAAHSFTMSLREQLKNTKIKVVETLPPTVDTEFNKGIEAPKISPEKYTTRFLTQLQKGNEIIRIGQTALLEKFSRLLPAVAFRMLNK